MVLAIIYGVAVLFFTIWIIYLIHELGKTREDLECLWYYVKVVEDVIKKIQKCDLNDKKYLKDILNDLYQLIGE